jgi:hypothetical protein
VRSGDFSVLVGRRRNDATWRHAESRSVRSEPDDDVGGSTAAEEPGARSNRMRRGP